MILPASNRDRDTIGHLKPDGRLPDPSSPVTGAGRGGLCSTARADVKAKPLRAPAGAGGLDASRPVDSLAVTPGPLVGKSAERDQGVHVGLVQPPFQVQVWPRALAGAAD